MSSETRLVYKVGDLVNEMRRLMETSYPEIWIEGELSSLSKPASGHLYFSLKDDQSQLRCAMFKGRASVNRYQPKAGDLVRVRAKISVYPARGELQCIVQYMEDAGEGVLQRRFEELKAKLNAENLFSLEHKKKLPTMPKRIGLITSPTGAAVRDVLSTLKRRCPGIPIVLYPAVVQGESAAQTLITALQNAQIHQQCDIIIIGRGGGSLEDLWCFNDENLVRAIHACTLPVISAIGHEVDITLADYVADLRAPTPTAAAELVSPDQHGLLADLSLSYRRLQGAMQRYVERRSQTVDMTAQQLKHPRTAISANGLRLRSTSKQLLRIMQNRMRQQTLQFNTTAARFTRNTPQAKISLNAQYCDSLLKRLNTAQERQHQGRLDKIHSLSRQLDGVSPLQTLGRGFAIARDSNKAILRSSDSVSKGDTISVQLGSGELACKVEQIEE